MISPLILTLEQIKTAIVPSRVIKSQEEGFVLYSNGEADIPPFGSLHFESPPGDVHIKHGVIRGDAYYVVKIASGFYDNPKMGIASNQGLMLIFSAKTGKLCAILLDEAYLTEYRTGAAGAVCAKYLAPKEVSKIGIVGTGTQAFYQLFFLSEVVSCKKVLVWGRDKEKAKKLSQHPLLSNFQIEIADDIREIPDECNLIVTTTPSRAPLLFAEWIRSGTHITAVGADGGGKQELDPWIFQKADIVCVDSRSQCMSHGDLSFAAKQGIIFEKDIVEIGEIIINPLLRRKNSFEITVADLTGIAIQDIQIAKEVYRNYKGVANAEIVV